MHFCHQQEIHPTNFGIKLLHTTTKTELYPAKIASKKLAYKTAEATSEFTVKKIAEDDVKPKLAIAEAMLKK